MPTVWKFLVAAVALAPAAVLAADPQPAREPPRPPAPDRGQRLYDFRVFQAAPGKLDALHARLRDHQIPLLEQHGICTQGVFVPARDNPHEVVYLLTAAEGLGPMVEGWAGFREDAAWLEVLAKTGEDGTRAAQEGCQRLRTIEWSPELKPGQSATPRVFELRTYTCPDASKHLALQRRFRDHTMKLFEKHGMQNIVYWIPAEDEPEGRHKLLYLLAHDSQAAAQKSFEAFRSDPDWITARKASEQAAGGALTNPEKGVVSEFLEATEYSPLK